MNPEWMWGCLYLGAYGFWAWTFRTRVDPWMRRQLGLRLSADVVWVPASTFPIELWVWGLRRPSDDEQGAERAHRLALTSVAAGLGGAFLPTALLCAFESWGAGLPEAVNGALYLTTPLLVMVFVVWHLRRHRLDLKYDS